MFDIINHKLFKMKKIFLFVFLLSINNLIGQNMSFRVWEIKVKDQAKAGLLRLFDDHFKVAEIKENGAILLEEYKVGAPREMTHRIIFLNEIGRIGDMITNKSEAEKKLFWERVKNKIDKWGSTFSGRMLSWHPGDFSKFPSIHLWHIKPNNPMQFKNAHDKFVESAGSYFDGKAIGFGTIDIGSPDGSSHWVAFAAEKYSLIKMHHDFDTRFGKLQQEWWKTNGGVEISDDFSVLNLRTYQ